MSNIQFKVVVLPRQEVPQRNPFLPTATERDLQKLREFNLRHTSELALDLA